MPDGGPRLPYKGFDALITRELRERLSVSSVDIPPGAALVGTARCFGGVLRPHPVGTGLSGGWSQHSIGALH